MKVSSKEVAILMLVVIAVTYILAPTFARVGRSASDARCQSNLYHWARALNLYAADNVGAYPINLAWSGESLNPSPDVKITPIGTVDSNGHPVRFKYGLNWAELVEPYLQSQAGTLGQDWRPFLRCPNASTAVWPTTAVGTAQVSYAFNANLVARQLLYIARNPKNLMLLREMDRTVESVLRPTNQGTGVPVSPFLTTTDAYIGTTNPNLHGSGSYIAFADGHVAYFTTDYFPATLTAANCYDSTTGQWFNYGPGSGAPANLMESIAITP